MKVCSICNKEYDGYGNNAWPFNRDECCTTCNNSIVIPLRIFLSGSIKNQILCINTNRELIYMPVNEEVKLAVQSAKCFQKRWQQKVKQDG